jgi:hypothetical protein
MEETRYVPRRDYKTKNMVDMSFKVNGGYLQWRSKHNKNPKRFCALLDVESPNEAQAENMEDKFGCRC